MKISIVIVNWNTKDFLRQCLKSVHNNFYNKPYEIIVVDNNSKDGSPEMVKFLFPEIRLIQNKNNLGFAKANNQAIRIAKGEYVLLLNSDIEILENAIEILISSMDNDQKIGAMGGMQLSPEKVIQTVAARNFPTILTEFFVQTNLANWFPKNKLFAKGWGANFDHRVFQEVDTLSGAFMILRNKTINEIGAFDENIFMYSEDIELCYRIKKAGWKIVYNPNAKAIHYFNQSAKKFKEFTKGNINIKALQSKYYFFKKHYGKSYAFLFRLMTLATSFFWILFWAFFLLFRKNKNVLKETWANKITIFKSFLYSKNLI